MTDHRPSPLPRSAVRFRADVAALGIETSADLEPAQEIVGQENALVALELGLAMNAPGYNVFLTGDKGTGRFLAVRQLIAQQAVECPLANSHCYVHNFLQPDRPLLVTLPRGQGKEFQNAVDHLRESLQEEIPALLGSEVLVKTRQRILGKFERETKRLFGDFEGRVGQEGFTIAETRTQTGTIQMADIFPVVKGEPVSMEQIEADPAEVGMTDTDVAALGRQRQAFQSELQSLAARHRRMRVKYQTLLRDSERKKVGDAIAPLFDDVRERFGIHHPDVDTWLKGLNQELLEHLELFRDTAADGQSNPSAPSFEGFAWYIRANLLWDAELGTTESNGCPVIEEAWPTWRNLFGTFEASGDPPIPTFMDVRAGSLLRANGGFLVLYAQDVLSEPRVYDNLKRILRKGELEIGPPQEGHQPLIGLKPTPIPVKVKVILVGERHAYDVLHAMDVDFASIFKVKVELDDRMPRTEESLRGYLGVLRRIIDREKLPPFEAGALGRVIEEGVRLSGHQDYLSTRFAELANIMRESAWLAGRRGAETVSRDDQIAAIRNRYARHDLIERSMLDMIRTGKILLETQGRSVGQINGLGLYDLDDAVFGFPARISATCAIGRQGVVNIEREAELSGSIHNKGILILSGFLAARFAQDKPLSLHANIAFEQSYATVDGDSATLAELLAVLSSLSGIPLRQDIAVTGSLNQRGQVQPVGGVTEKVRGFYQACRIQGFTGTQGVILPAQNVDELHMEDEICDAMDAGRFFIWSASDYKEAVELLTEHACTEVMTVCDDRLRGYAETVQRFT